MPWRSLPLYSLCSIIIPGSSFYERPGDFYHLSSHRTAVGIDRASVFIEGALVTISLLVIPEVSVYGRKSLTPVLKVIYNRSQAVLRIILIRIKAVSAAFKTDSFLYKQALSVILNISSQKVRHYDTPALRIPPLAVRLIFVFKSHKLIVWLLMAQVLRLRPIFLYFHKPSLGVVGRFDHKL